MRKRMIALVAVLTLVGAACADSYEGGDTQSPTTTTSTTESAGNSRPGPTTTTDAPSSTDSNVEKGHWPLLDRQMLPTGAREGAYGSKLRNLGVNEVAWSTDPAGQVIERARHEPLFAVNLAQTFGSEAGHQVGFSGLSGLWEEGKWTKDGRVFLARLEVEARERADDFAGLPADTWVVLADSNTDAVRLRFAESELPMAGILFTFRTECGEVGVDVRGNLYIPCGCGGFPNPPQPPPPPCQTNCGPPPPCTYNCGGKDAGDAPTQDPVLTCPSGYHMSRETETCVLDAQPTDPVPDAGDPDDGDSGTGAPGPGVETPEEDPAANPEVPDGDDGNTGPIEDPGV